MTHSIRIWLLLALLVVPAAILAAAGMQLEMGIFRGTVEDQQGKGVPGVHFRLKDPKRGGEVTIETDDRGNFYKRSLPPGEYELFVEKQGYDPIHDRFVLKPGEETRLKFRLVVSVTPAEAAFGRGVQAFNAGDYLKAAAAFEEVVRLAPETPEGHTNLGLVYLRLSRLEDAVREFEGAAALNPSAAPAKFQLANAYAEAGQIDRAIAVFTSALGDAPNLSDPAALEASVTLGALYFAQGRLEAAIATYEKALGAQPALPAALLGLGKCHFNRGDLARALDYFHEVVEVASDSPKATEARAFIKELEK